MIPKIIHYCWFGGKPLPRDVEQCIASWKKHCPDYEIRQWNESNFDVTAHPFMKAAYEAKKWAFVSDYARLKVIYDHGGIYLDTDVELLTSLDSLLQHRAYFAVDQADGYVATGLGFGAEQGHSSVLRMLQQYDTVTFDPEQLVQLACPILNTRALTQLGFAPCDQVRLLCDGETAIYPPRYFDPIAPGNTRDLTCADTISVHHYNASWTSGKHRFKRKLMQFLGDKLVLRIKEMLR